MSRKPSRYRSPQYKTYLARIKRDHIPCVYCGAPANSIDHVHELWQGGTDTPDNWAPACLSCNVTKSNRLRNKHKARGGTRRRRTPTRWKYDQ